MKKIRLTERELVNLVTNLVKEETENTNNLVMKGEEILDSDSKKKRFKELCRQCIAEFEKTSPGFSRDMKVEEVLMGASLFLIAGAVFLNFLIGTLPAIGGFIMLGDDVRKKWKQVLDCVKKKKQELISIKSVSITPNQIQTGSETVQEKYIRKITKKIINS